MSARVEAALEAFRRERVWQEEETPIRAALAASDKVMFDEAAVERAAKAMFAEEQCDRRQKLDVEGNWKSRLDDRDRDEYRRMTRAVIAALKGDDG